MNVKKCTLSPFFQIVEEFFSREVNYVISTRCGQTAGGSSSEQQPSPSAVHTASPLTPQQPLSSLPSTSHDSPLNIDSPREDTGKKRVVSMSFFPVSIFISELLVCIMIKTSLFLCMVVLEALKALLFMKKCFTHDGYVKFR